MPVRLVSRVTGTCHCHAPAPAASPGAETDVLRAAIVGPPNVGKSVLFHALTGVYVTVSNYPGTTVDVMRGRGRGPWRHVEIIDTPGMYSLRPVTEEERVARRLLLEEKPDVVLQVVDVKHLERMLVMTLELLEAGLPLVLVVNFMDEAERLGIRVDTDGLSQALGIPVVPTALRQGRGVDRVWAAMAQVLAQPTVPEAREPVRYPSPIQEALNDLIPLLADVPFLSPRAVALLLLAGDAEMLARVREALGPRAAEVEARVARVQAQAAQPPAYVMARERRHVAQRLAAAHLTVTERARAYRQRLDDLLLNPWTGIPVLLLVLWLLYEMVGVLAAQVVVDFLEGEVFEAHINPWVDALLLRWVPWPALRALIGGEYGVVTLGLRYAVAIVLPIVGAFFLVFSVIEDSGYLPRLALMVDRAFKRLGLNGRAVIPMVLGFGCDTMATIVTRTLETRRERLISTLLLALAIPCSAQLGVILGLLGSDPRLLLIWGSVVAAIFLTVGYLAAQLLPGEPPAFYVELPPLRWPHPGNVLVKTYTRMEWYFREVLPLFVLASVLIWAGRLTGAFDLAVQALTPAVRWLGLPDAAAVAFLFGFFRRDYGAAGLYDLRQALTSVQLVVAATTLTLFVPCVAQFAVMTKERGWRTALAVVAFIIPLAFLVGGILFRVLTWAGL